MGRTFRAALGLTGMALAAHAAPALTAIGPLRKRLLPHLAGVGDPGHVALTFDDGPDPASTPAFLKVLDEYQVKATFFLLGRMLWAAPELGRDLVEDLVQAGHGVAVHGWAHRLTPLRGPYATYNGPALTSVIVAVTGDMPRWYRPPYSPAPTRPFNPTASRSQPAADPQAQPPPPPSGEERTP